jgi:ribonuclease-3
MTSYLSEQLLRRMGIDSDVVALPHIEPALTHSSTGTQANYERLEFVGDRVLGLVVAQMLYEFFPEESEGGLAKRHAALVQGKTLAQIAREIGLGDALILSDAERAAGGAENENILADGLEAVIGALYLDAGLETCARAVRQLWASRIDVLSEPPQDPKTALQEWAQGRGLPLPVYELIGREGPDHAPQFDVRATVKGFSPVQARGASIRAAEKAAARQLLDQVRKETGDE